MNRLDWLRGETAGYILQEESTGQVQGAQVA